MEEKAICLKEKLPRLKHDINSQIGYKILFGASDLNRWLVLSLSVQEQESDDRGLILKLDLDGFSTCAKGRFMSSSRLCPSASIICIWKVSQVRKYHVREEYEPWDMESCGRVWGCRVLQVGMLEVWHHEKPTPSLQQALDAGVLFRVIALNDKNRVLLRTQHTKY